MFILEDRFYVGQRVRFVYRPELSGNIRFNDGDTGTVAVVTPDSVGIKWDKRVALGHDLGGLCEMGHGWFIHPRYIEPYQDDSFEPASDDELIQFLFDKQ